MNLRFKAALLGTLLALSLSAARVANAADAKPTNSATDKVSEKAEQPLPSAKEVLDRYGKAIGGKDAYSKHTSQHATGTVQMIAQGLSGKLEVFAARPNKLVMKMSMAGIGDFDSGYDGKVGWMTSPLTGPMIVSGKTLPQIATQADFDQAFHNPADYKVAEVLGVTDFNGEECYKLKLVHRTGYSSIEYFSVKSGLQRGYTTTEESPLGPMTSTTTVKEYKQFGDLYLPSKISQKASGLETVMTISETEYDNVPDSAFDLPNDVKTLLNKASKAEPNSAPGSASEPKPARKPLHKPAPSAPN
jgi:hypothetical protein